MCWRDSKKHFFEFPILSRAVDKLILRICSAGPVLKSFVTELQQFWKCSLRTQSAVCKLCPLIDWPSQKPTTKQQEKKRFFVIIRLTTNIFERPESDICWSIANSEKYSSGFGQFYTNLLRKFTFVKFALRIFRCLECICEAMPHSMNKTFAERFVLVLFK